jgi:DNA-binding NarL/FixJ family response regulator
MTIAYPREKVLAAFEMKEAGVGRKQIARDLQVRVGTLRNWFSDPDMDLHLDEIAIERAVAGDIPVYDALTYYEREEVLSILVEKFDGIDFKERFGGSADRILGAVHNMRERDAVRAKRAARAPVARPKGVTVKKRGPEFDARVAQLHRDGTAAPDIALEVGVSLTTVRRVLKSAA